MSELSTEQQFFTTNPDYRGCVVDFKYNMFTGANQSVLYDTEGNRLAMVQQEGFNDFRVYPTAD